MTAISTATLIQRIRWHLGDFPWETTGTAASASSVIAVADGTDWSEGDYGELIDAVTGTAEGFWTQSVAANNLTTVRGYYGSTAATHATTSRILKNPKYKTLEITNAISEVIEYMLPWPRVYKIVADTITPDIVNKVWYDLAADALALVRVYQLYSTSDRKARNYGERHQYTRVRYERGLPTGLVASGVGVSFPDGFGHTTNTVYIDYAAKITDTVAGGLYSDLFAGDAVTAAVEYGVVALLQGSLELRKPRSSGQDPDQMRPASMFQNLYEKALMTAEKECRQRNPLMEGWSK